MSYFITFSPFLPILMDVWIIGDEDKKQAALNENQ